MRARDAEITFEIVRWTDDRPRIEIARRAVFIEEQRIPESEEWDDADPLCWHLLALGPNRDVVGTGRLDPAGKIGRVAVLPQYRGTGIGAEIVSRLVDLAARQGLTQVYLNAQVSALRFYERLSFQAEGPEFDEVGIPHRRMRRRIGKRDEQHVGRDGNAEHPVEPG